MAPGTRCAIQPASFSRRAALAPSEPRRAWNTTPSSSGTRLGERPLAILVPEELGVPQARAQHALVACDDRPAIVLGRQIGDRDEARRQATVRVLERQVLLMMAHRRDQDFLGQRHEPLVDPAKQGDRPLDQAGELGEQCRIVAQAQILLAREPRRLAL